MSKPSSVCRIYHFPSPIERQETKTYIDVTTPEVREMQRLNRRVDLLGQAIVAVLIPVGVLVIVYNLVRWLCGN